MFFNFLNSVRIPVKRLSMFGLLSKKISVFIVYLLCFCSVSFASLGSKIDGIINRPSQKKIQFAVKIVKAATGKVVYERNGHQPMTPASNMKLVISATAMRYLGDDYEFTTTVGLLGDTLVVIGRGDPLLGDKATDAAFGRRENWLLDDIVEAVKQAGADSISGIIIDSIFFDDISVNPNWPISQLNRPYACQIGGLNYNGNCVRITATNVNGRVRLQVKPETAYLNIINKAKAVSKGSSAIGSYRNAGINNITVHGKCRKSAGFDVAIERPAGFFGFLLAERLNSAGISVQGQLIEKHIDTKGMNVLREYNTSIERVLYRCNKDSFNLAAESLFKTISAQANGKKMNGSWQGGHEVISKYLNSLSISSDEFYIDDGSGLSSKNKLSTNAIVKILLNTYKTKQWPIFKGSLAVGGQDGTARKYFKDKKYKGKIFGKTGYIKGVKAFSGVCETNNGEFVFSILTNNSYNGKTRAAINDIVKAIIDTN